MDKKVNQAIIRMEASIDEFFLYWCKFLRPLHNLTDREIQVVAEILKKRFHLAKSIDDQELIDQLLFSPETKAEIRDIVGMSVTHYNCVIKRLREVKILLEHNQINRRFIPKISEKDTNFNLNLYFEIK
jgi:hypothetical protein